MDRNQPPKRPKSIPTPKLNQKSPKPSPSRIRNPSRKQPRPRKRRKRRLLHLRNRQARLWVLVISCPRSSWRMRKVGRWMFRRWLGRMALLFSCIQRSVQVPSLSAPYLLISIPLRLISTGGCVRGYILLIDFDVVESSSHLPSSRSSRKTIPQHSIVS